MQGAGLDTLHVLLVQTLNVGVRVSAVENAEAMLVAAQAARGVLDARYVPCRVVRAPKAAAKRGCGYAVRVEGRDGARSAALLREAGQRFSGVFRLLPDGTAEEAAL